MKTGHGTQAFNQRADPHSAVPLNACSVIDKDLPGRESFFALPCLPVQTASVSSVAMSSVSACLNDDSLEPAVRGCRGNFDFTVAFEDVAFAIVPATAFICLGLLRILALCRRRRPVVGSSAVQWTKLVCVSALGC